MIFLKASEKIIYRNNKVFSYIYNRRITNIVQTFKQHIFLAATQDLFLELQLRKGTPVMRLKLLP